MARQRRTSGHDAHAPIELERTRTSTVWVAVAVGMVFLVLLIIFIAQNDRQVAIHFLGANGHVSEALALIAAALAGAVLVFTVGAARIIQLRVAGHRHNKAVARQREQATAAAETPSATPAAPSATPPAVSEAQPVQAEHNA